MKTCSFLRYGWLALMLLLLPLAAYGEDVNIDALRESVEKQVAATYRDKLGEAASKEQLAIEVGNLDPRLRLAECRQPLAMKIKEPPQGQGNLTVKVSCESGQRWTIYVPVRVDRFAEVAVASRNLARGHVIDKNDVSFQRNNVSHLGSGHVEDINRLMGMELQRPMRSGEAFRLSGLELPEVVKRGDSVIIEAQAGTLTVVAPGKALGSGSVGSQVRVQNTQSKRVIDAEITGPGRVRVLL
jgi:flagella basal body P-ring formation protein FlgA